jgi:hypothetical protein
MNAHRMVVIAAALTTLVTAMLASALAVLGGQALPIAMHHDLSGAGNTTIDIGGNVNSGADAQYGAVLPHLIGKALDGTPFTLYHGAWSNPLGFASGAHPASGSNTPIVEAASLGDVAAHATLTSGAWPGAATSGTIPAALPATAAALMHVSVGQVLTLKDRDVGRLVRFTITGLYRPSQVAGPGAQYWQLDTISLSGQSTASGFTTYGPLTVQPAAFGGGAAAAGPGQSGTAGALIEDQATWVAQPQTSLLPQNQFSTIAGNLNDLRNSLGNPASLPTLQLTSNLPSVLSAVAANLDVAR